MSSLSVFAAVICGTDEPQVHTEISACALESGACTPHRAAVSSINTIIPYSSTTVPVV